MKKPRIEIVRSRARKLYTRGATNYQLQYHARVKARNGEIVWTTETYLKRGAAKKAILLLLNLAASHDIYEVDETKAEKKP